MKSLLLQIDVLSDTLKQEAKATNHRRGKNTLYLRTYYKRRNRW